MGQLLIGLLFNLPLYLTNTWYSGHLPFNTNKLYDRFGKRFVTKSVVDERGNLDLAKYRSYSVQILVFYPWLTFSLFMQPQAIPSSSLFTSPIILHQSAMSSYSTTVKFGPGSKVHLVVKPGSNSKMTFTIA